MWAFWATLPQARYIYKLSNTGKVTKHAGMRQNMEKIASKLHCTHAIIFCHCTNCGCLEFPRRSVFSFTQTWLLNLHHISPQGFSLTLAPVVFIAIFPLKIGKNHKTWIASSSGPIWELKSGIASFSKMRISSDTAYEKQLCFGSRFHCCQNIETDENGISPEERRLEYLLHKSAKETQTHLNCNSLKRVWCCKTIAFPLC